VKERDERETHTERDTRTQKTKRERERERREEGKIETRKNGKKPLDPNLTLIDITIRHKNKK
jgi:predicted amidophosphoribosyltransferase